MVTDKPHVSIIMLNWNGWQDTIECLESVLKLEYNTFNIILIDNNSSDNSLAQIRNWANGEANITINTKFPDLIYPLETKPINVIEISGDDDFAYFNSTLGNREIVLLKNSDNVGFAVANNQGMVLSSKLFQSKYYFLLNNDMVVEKDALTDLVEKLEEDNTISVAQSTIYSYEIKDEIANTGGKILFWGQTKHFKQIDTNEVRKISFICGGALFIRAEVIRSYGYLSGKFFFGEEDFEYSMRMKKNHLKMVCSGGSHVHHKVGISVKKLMHNYEQRTFLFALNRMVDLKDYFPKFIWHGWRILFLIYFAYLFWIRYKVPLRRTMFLIMKVYIYSGKLNDVKKDTVERVYSELDLR